ncbi:MAG: FG-GAP repeat domain-containing protein [Pyrinomonadaceae bacterium]
MKKSRVRLVFFAWCTIVLLCNGNVFPQKEVSQSKLGKNQAENVSPAATLLVDDFTAAPGSLLTANGWTAHSGGGTNSIATSSPGLTLTGYPSSGVGNAVSLTTTGEDVNRTFAVQSTGSVYAAFMVTVSEATTDPLGGYFFHFGPDPVGTTFRGRVFIAKDGSNNVAFGISKALTTAGNITFTPFSFSLNTTYLVVVKYTIVDGATNDTVSLFVSTTVPASEPAPTVTATDITQTDISPGTVSLRQGAVATSPTARVDGIRVGNTWADVTTSTPTNNQNHVDFNGDGRTDFAVVRNTGGGPGGQITWFVNLNGPGTTFGSQWGISGDSFVPEDYDGDNKSDIAIWRAGAPTVAAFYILQSLTNTVRIEPFGQTGDDPRVVGDYDGDGKADPAVYRAGANSGDQSTWFYRGSLNPAFVTYAPWGQNGDFPAPGDYDGDGKRDFVIQRNNGGGQARFWMQQTTAGFNSIVFGTPTDVIVPGDYDGDGKTDLAVARGSAGQINWYVRPSTTGAISAAPYAIFGASATDFHTHGDYDGDGKTDVAIWRPSATPGASVFWVFGSTSGAFAVPFGANGDYPIANYNRF